jgi:Spy/CpxP family protein refolding chaperone
MEVTVRILAIATAAVLMAMPLAAQQYGHDRHGDQPRHDMGMMGEHCVKMMGGSPPAMLLHHQEELGLSADQIRRIEQLQADTHGGAHMGAVMAAHREAAGVLQADRPDFAAYETKLREAAGHMIQAHTQMARATVEARGILTPEQREKVAGMAHGPASHGHGHGAMGGEGRSGMMGMMGMMQCPMMGMAPGAHEGREGREGHHNH